MTRRVWIVEIWERGRWAPTTGCHLDRADARLGCKYWHEDNPADRFRVREYVAVETKGTR